MTAFGQRIPEIRARPPGPRSLALARRLAEVESRNVTHLSADFPVFWEEAHGANVRDVDGNVYLDLSGAFGVALAGHGPERVVSAIRDQASLLVHGMGDVHPPEVKVRFLEALARLAPWPEARTVLASSGSEAVEIALKTALMATGRPGVVAFEGAYHGLTLGALAATHREDFRGPFLSRTYPGVRFAPFPGGPLHAPVAAEESLDRVAWFLREGDGGDEVGAIIVEPIQGRAGVRIPPPGFLSRLAELAEKAGTLLIFDEIFTGLGRTGKLFACQHDDVVPDLICLGKGLGGGVPLSACVGPPRVMNAWPTSSGEAIHTSTFLGNPLACASGLAFLGALEQGGLVDRSLALGETLLSSLGAALSGVEEVGQIRGRGLFLGLELVEPGSGAPRAGAAVRAAEAALKEGLLVLPAGEAGHVLELSPPLVITEEQLEWAVPRLAEVLTASLAG